MDFNGILSGQKLETVYYSSRGPVKYTELRLPETTFFSVDNQSLGLAEVSYVQYVQHKGW